MIRNLKVLGLALVAVFAFSAVIASAASAQNGKLTSTGPVTLDGTEDGLNAFTAFGGAVVQCPGSTITAHNYLTTEETETGKVHGLIPVGAETVTLTPDYAVDNCKTTEGGATHFTTVTMNGCDYVLHLGKTNGEIDTYNTTVDIVCPTGKSIILDVYFSSTPTNENLKVCEVTVKAQGNIGGAVITDETNGHLTVHGTYKPIHTERSGVCGSKTDANAEFHVNLTVTGTNSEGESTKISLSHEP